ncbi:MAG: hypothetical protein MZU97_11565 [Bacillus subtilis]|nr:hypothetical protein [Bacillus subtilis]
MARISVAIKPAQRQLQDQARTARPRPGQRPDHQGAVLPGSTSTTMVLRPENLDEEQVLLKMVSKDIAENAQFLFRDSKKIPDALQSGITLGQALRL